MHTVEYFPLKFIQTSNFKDSKMSLFQKTPETHDKLAVRNEQMGKQKVLKIPCPPLLLLIACFHSQSFVNQK